jgi:hypothetical protein
MGAPCEGRGRGRTLIESSFIIRRCTNFSISTRHSSWSLLASRYHVYTRPQVLGLKSQLLLSINLHSNSTKLSHRVIHILLNNLRPRGGIKAMYLGIFIVGQQEVSDSHSTRYNNPPSNAPRVSDKPLSRRFYRPFRIPNC